MPLIQTELTTEQKQARTRAVLDTHLIEGAKELYYRSEKVWEQFWKNPLGLSCQEVFDSFGPHALSMAMMLAKSKAQIDAVDPSMWQLERLGSVTPVIVDGQPTGSVVVTLNP